MNPDWTLRYEGPRELTVTDREPAGARLGLYCRSAIPAGTEVCVTAGDYRAHSEGPFTVEGVSATDGAVDLVEAEPPETFFETAQRQLGDSADRVTRLGTARVTEQVDRDNQLHFEVGVGAGVHAGNDLVLDVRARPPGVDGDAYERVGGRVVVPVRAGPPAGIEMRPQVDGRRLHATVFATDALLNPAGYPDTVRVAAVEGAVEGLPRTVSPGDGPVTVSGHVTDAPVRLRAVGDRGETATTARLDAAGSVDRPLFGAIHFHTRFSGDGGRPMADAYRYARDVLNLDFAAATDHTPAPYWEEIVEINEAFDDPGAFATLPAWEWSTDDGHANLYLRSADSDARPDAAYDGEHAYDVDWPGDAIMAPHHTNQRSDELTDDGQHYWHEYDWSVPNDRMGFVEIHQTRGNFEADEVDPAWRIKTGGIGASVRDALARGYRLGFVAGTDNHTGYPTRGAIGSHGDVVGRYVGLTGVHAGERTREAIWDALAARRTYATTGVPIRVAVAVNGAPMGGVVPADSTPTVDARLYGTAPVERVEIVADGETVWETAPDDREVHIQDEPLPDPGDPGYWYLRLRQADDHMAWASPVWLDR